MSALPRQLASIVVAALVTACGNEDGSAPEDTAVVVGLTSDLAVGFDIDRVVATMRVDGATVRTSDLAWSDGRLVLPGEFWFDQVPDGAEVDLEFLAYPKDTETSLLSRRTRTIAQAGRTPLLQVALEEACVGVSCAGGDTCIEGVCRDAYVDPSALPDHDDAWLLEAPDACSTPDDEQSLTLGQGRYAYEALEDGAIMTLEAGPQGGYHVWLALRAGGFRQVGSLVSVRGTLPALDREVPAFVSSVTLHREAGTCELFGVRFRVDQGLLVEELLGQPLDIELTVSDETGDTLTVARGVQLADTFVPLP